MYSASMTYKINVVHLNYDDNKNFDNKKYYSSQYLYWLKLYKFILSLNLKIFKINYKK